MFALTPVALQPYPTAQISFRLSHRRLDPVAEYLGIFGYMKVAMRMASLYSMPIMDIVEQCMHG
jgi:hypothetical protein